MTTTTRPTSAAELVSAFAGPRGDLADRADLARFLREHGLVNAGAIPITLADFDEALSLRDGIRALLFQAAGRATDEDALARGQRVLDGLRVTVRLDPQEQQGVLAPAVVDEVRRGLARIAGAWAAVALTGEWRGIDL
ncbi:ABATE domain-containing protein [Nocardiopsis suaedae]|uniref:ABATE domain-containing protein n=1 Tax=Nocardiopsis suaedae TaxID=3018444 RepID=A0ABT4TJP0_9ACTN|nr:ABATE domain-containing protein [Nocardiopsis suaedae]MDA2804884.1 ABATE domain-containing protein [Nocardiopsis suaedae]